MPWIELYHFFEVFYSFICFIQVLTTNGKLIEYWAAIGIKFDELIAIESTFLVILSKEVHITECSIGGKMVRVNRKAFFNVLNSVFGILHFQVGHAKNKPHQILMLHLLNQFLQFFQSSISDKDIEIHVAFLYFSEGAVWIERYCFVVELFFCSKVDL